MKLVEQRRGVGRLTVRGEDVGDVPYSFDRFQAMTPAGLPVPGLHRIEGMLTLDSLPADLAVPADTHLSLDIEDGRRFELTLIDADGRVLAEGHGPGKCGCC